jgi:hypothetical protein
MLSLQRTGVKGQGVEDGHTLKKRQASNERRVRCPLSVRLDYKLFKILDGTGEDPEGVLLSMILRVRKFEVQSTRTLVVITSV